jgi:hypothetical protein
VINSFLNDLIGNLFLIPRVCFSFSTVDEGLWGAYVVSWKSPEYARSKSCVYWVRIPYLLDITE